MENDQRTDPMARVFPKVKSFHRATVTLWPLHCRSPSALSTSLEPLEASRSLTESAFSRSTLSTKKSTSSSGSGSSCLPWVWPGSFQIPEPLSGDHKASDDLSSDRYCCTTSPRNTSKGFQKKNTINLCWEQKLQWCNKSTINITMLSDLCLPCRTLQ